MTGSLSALLHSVQRSYFTISPSGCSGLPPGRGRPNQRRRVRFAADTRFSRIGSGSSDRHRGIDVSKLAISYAPRRDHTTYPTVMATNVWRTARTDADSLGPRDPICRDIASSPTASDALAPRVIARLGTPDSG